MNTNVILAVLVFYPFLGALLCAVAGNPPELLLRALRKCGAGRPAGTAGAADKASVQSEDAAGKAAVQQLSTGGKIAAFLSRNCDLHRDYIGDFIVISEFVMLLLLALACGGGIASGTGLKCTVPGICGFGLYFTMEGFRLVYALIASLMWMMTTILSREYFAHHGNRTRFYIFLLMTFGATMGVFLSGDLYTTFVFFEIMSFTSYVWVAQEETGAALRAAETYLGVAVIGGLVMLMGLFMIYHELGTLRMSELLASAQACEDKTLLYAAGVCALVGFGAKAGAFPLHIWLPKAHPVAPAPASTLLSGILTKTGIFGILVISSNLFLHDAAWGKLILTIGVLTMFGGAMLAVFSVDLKRTLACSSMSQIGFIMVGVGMQGLLGEENALAVHGTLLHMVNHSLIKLVLFMAAGVIFMNTHALELNTIRGFGRKKPLLKVIFLIGALAIGGIPLFSGYVSKTLLHESIVEFGGGWVMRGVEYIFLFSGGLTVAYMTKLFTAIFVERNENAEVQRKYDNMKHYMNWESTFALAGSALILLIWGFFPHTIMDRAAELGQEFMHLEEFGHVVSYFSLTNLSGGLISITIGVLVYVFVIRGLLMKQEKKNVRVYINAWLAWFDLENLIYRPLVLQLLPYICELPFRLGASLRPIWFKFIPTVCHIAVRIFDSLPDLIVVALRRSVYRDSPLPHERSEGTVFTAAAGCVLNFFQGIANRLWRRKSPVKKDYRHILAVKHTEFKESGMIIGRSLSFALLLFCVGLGLTLVYLILW